MQRLHYNLDRLEIVLAIHLMMAAQGIDLISDQMAELNLSERTRHIHNVIRSHIPSLGDDRYMRPDVAKAIEMVKNGVISDSIATEPMLNRTNAQWKQVGLGCH